MTKNTPDEAQDVKVGLTPVRGLAQAYLQSCGVGYSADALSSAARLGSELFIELGSIEAAVQELQDVRLLSKQNLLEAAERSPGSASCTQSTSRRCQSAESPAAGAIFRSELKPTIMAP